MVINKERLGCILFFGVLLNLVGSFLVYRSAVFFLCPEPAVSLECFDTLRSGMTEGEARNILERPRMFLCDLGGPCMEIPLGDLGGPIPPAHHELPFRGDDL